MPSLFFIKDGEKTMANADVKLLFGVLGGGSISEGSGLEIKRDLDEILAKINKNPFKIKVALDADANKKSSWTAQLQKKLDALNNGNKLSVTVSNIKLGTSAITSFKNQLGAVINTLNLDKDVSVSFTAKDIGEITSQFKSAGDAADAAAKRVAEFKVQMEMLSTQKATVKNLLTSLDKTVTTEDERVRLAEINALYQQWAVNIEAIRASKTAASATTQAELMAEGAAIRSNISDLLENMQAARERADAEAEAAQKSESAETARMATLNEVINAYKRINEYINKNPRIDGDELTQLKSMRDQLYGVWQGSKNAADGLTSISKIDLRKILSDFAGLDTSLTEAGKKGNTLVGVISSAYKKFGGWMLVTRSLMQVVSGIRSMVTNVIELDAAMTELRKVTDETEASYTRFFNNAIARSKQLGATLTDTITATADFARLGYSIDEAADLADAALVYKNVGDGIEDISTASESVISTMKAFRIEASSAMLIVDKFNEVGNNFAISSKGVGDALVRSAAALASAGNSLDESIALITAANTIVQNPDVVGTTMKTLSMYLRAAKTEAEEAGESTEGMANSISELRDEILALTGGKVDIQIDENTFKNTTQILRELAGVWDELTDISQANILEMIGGKRNANTVASLLENFDLVEDVLESSVNAAGSALAENEKYLDSINGKIAKFQAAFESLSATLIDSDLVKSIVDAGTGIVETLTVIIDKLGAIPSLISSIAGALTVYQKAKSGSDFGLFGIVDGDIGYDPSGIRGTISEYNSLLSKSIDEQSDFIANLKISDKTLAGYLETVTDGSASFKGYKTYCKQAGVETKTLGATSKIASVGVTLLNTAMNMLISLGVTLAIQGIISVITHLVNATEEAVERTQELNNAFKEFKETNSDNIKTLESLKGEFSELSKGVSRYGENVALTSDEYERYKEIIETIVGISPSLSEGYSAENGYLADKNGLIERAIELQEQQYRQELRQMTTMENLKTGMEGYIATYKDLWLGNNLTSETDLSNSIWKLFRVNDRDVTPDFADVNGGDGKSVYLAEQVIKALGIDNVDAEIEKYLNDHGYFQSSSFMDDYAEAIAQNYEKIAASIDYSEIGYKTKTEFDEAVSVLGDAATEYLGVQNQMAEANAGIANQLKLVAEYNSNYANLSDEAKNIVSNFVNQFGVEDVYKQDFLGNWVPDEDAINSARVKINQFVESITPEVQTALSNLFDLRGKFELGDIGVDEFKSGVGEIINKLTESGFDGESIKYLKLSLNTDLIDTQLDAVRKAIDGIDGTYDEALGELSGEELAIAYKVVQANDSLTFDELMNEIQRVKSQAQIDVTITNLSETITNLQSAYDVLASAQQEMAKGNGLSEDTIKNLLAVNKDYLDYLYEENGVIKLNTEAWKENANAKIRSEMSSLEQEIYRLAEQNQLLTERNNLLASQPSSATNTDEIEENSKAIAENTQRIQDNQGKLAIYSSLYGSITGDMSAYTNALNNFANIATTIDSVASSYASLANLQNAVAEGFTLSLDKILEYAKAYPQILNNATVAANGELALNEAVVNSFIEGQKAKLNAQIDAQIAELESDKAVLEAKKEFATAQLELAKAAINGESEMTTEFAINRLNMGNALVEALIAMGIEEATAFKLATEAMAGNEEEFARVAAECFENVDKNSAKAAYNMAQGFFVNSKNSVISISDIALAAQNAARAIQGMINGVVDGSTTTFTGAEGVYTGEYGYEGVDANFDGTAYEGYKYKSASLDKYITDLELDISEYTDAISQIDGQIAALEALKNTPFENSKNLVDNASSIVGEKTNDRIEKEQSEAEKAAKEEEEKKKLVEEYIAAIDEYYEALKRLEEVQKRRASLEKKLEHTEDLSEKIFLSSGLIDVYKEEVEAERNLMSAKQATIAANVGALRGLGFEVDYDSSTNELYIRNLEHLNELTASSAGKYETLQEATNALRKETEELIDATEQLNDDNIEAAGNIEDLGYEILETKNNIIDYVEEIYNAQVESYQKIIDLRKELLESAKEELDYESDVADKVKEIAELQARIDQLALDDSRGAQAERNTLMQQLAEKQKELAETQGDHATDAQLDALDKMAEDFANQKADEIETLRDTVSTSEELWDAFYKTILGQNVTVGESIDAEIANAWIRAAEAVNEYSASLRGITSGGTIVSTVPKYHDGGVVNESNIGKDEALAILQRGEVVLNEGKQKTLYRIIDFQSELSKRLGIAIGSLSGLGNGATSAPNPQKLLSETSGTSVGNTQSFVFEPHIDIQIQHNGNVSDSDAKSYGDQIANITIEKLYSAFERRGINSTRGSRLKP